jgi:hypothetical protein
MSPLYRDLCTVSVLTDRRINWWACRRAKVKQPARQLQPCGLISRLCLLIIAGASTSAMHTPIPMISLVWPGGEPPAQQFELT